MEVLALLSESLNSARKRKSDYQIIDKITCQCFRQKQLILNDLQLFFEQLLFFHFCYSFQNGIRAYSLFFFWMVDKSFSCFYFFTGCSPKKWDKGKGNLWNRQYSERKSSRVNLFFKRIPEDCKRFRGIIYKEWHKSLTKRTLI